MNTASRRYLIFSLANQSFALPVEAMAEVMETQRTYPIPKAPPYFLGAMNYHGTPVPVLDLAAFLHDKPVQGTGSILVFHHSVGCLALRIDGVERMVSTIRGVHVQDESSTYSQQVLIFDNRRIPILIPELLVHALDEVLSPPITPSNPAKQSG